MAFDPSTEKEPLTLTYRLYLRYRAHERGVILRRGVCIVELRQCTFPARARRINGHVR